MVQPQPEAETGTRLMHNCILYFLHFLYGTTAILASPPNKLCVSMLTAEKAPRSSKSQPRYRVAMTFVPVYIFVGKGSDPQLNSFPWTCLEAWINPGIATRKRQGMALSVHHRPTRSKSKCYCSPNRVLKTKRKLAIE